MNTLIPDRSRRYLALGPVQMLCLEMTGNLPNTFAAEVARSAIGATCNVMANLVALDRDHQTGVLTALATDGHGDFVCNRIRAMGVDNSSKLITRVADETMQTPYMCHGFPIGLRGQVPVVRRRCDPMSKLTLDLARSYWDFDKLMSQTGLLHMCLHELGLNDEMPAIYSQLIDAAKKHDVTVMVNLNFRKGLFPTDADMNKWRACCQVFAEKADILVGSRAMALKDLGMPVIETGKAQSISERFPNLKLVALTGRDPKAATYSGELAISARQSWQVDPLPCDVRWPIGSGDAFDAGLIHGITKAWTYDQILAFAVNCARDNLSTIGDQSMATANQILQWADATTRT